MKVVFLYGPPAVGKLTVAEELSRLTGYKLFHNHLTNDLVESIFPRGTPQFRELVHRYRFELIEAAAENGISMIFTYVYAKSRNDDAFIEQVLKRVRKHGGEVDFVQLKCNIPVLRKRLKQPSRHAYRKIKNLKLFNALLKEQNVLSSVPHRRNLSLDNTNISAKEAAKIIKKHFKI